MARSDDEGLARLLHGAQKRSAEHVASLLRAMANSKRSDAERREDGMDRHPKVLTLFPGSPFALFDAVVVGQIAFEARLTHVYRSVPRRL